MTVDKYIDKLTIEVLLSSLPDIDRDIVTLWFLEGYKIEEISKIIKERYGETIKIQLISQRITEIIQKLRNNVGYKGDLYYIRRKRKKGIK